MKVTNKVTRFKLVDMIMLSLLYLPATSNEYTTLNTMHSVYYDSLGSQVNYLISANTGNVSDYERLNEVLSNAEYINKPVIENIFNNSVFKYLK